MAVLMNASVVTNFGVFEHYPIGLKAVKELTGGGFESYVGHQSTCDVLSVLLGQTVPLNRVQYHQDINESAIIFKLNGRIEEGKILTIEEIEEIGYYFTILTRVK